MGYISISISLFVIIAIRSRISISPSISHDHYKLLTSTSTTSASSSTKASKSTASESGFSGCLVLKDDNDRLSEWMAYHWQTLPLTHLIVATDPTGKTTSREILQLWNSTEMDMMDIILWDDADYGHWINDELDDLHKHRDRQKRFLAECMKYHKARGRSWTALIDPDEYITFNILSDDDRDPERKNDVDVFDFMDGPNFTQMEYRVQTHNLRREMTESNALQHQTVWDYIHQDQHQNQLQEPWKSEPCYLMLRTLFSAVESPPDILQDAGVAQYGFDSNKFTTLKYYKHGEKGSWHDNHFGKVILDLSRVDDKLITRDMPNIHTPIEGEGMCNYPFRLYETGLLRVHHYLGSWEQYSAREDVRRNRDKFDVSAFVNFGTDYQLQGWLKRFVETVGVEKSKLLLQHSGMIDVGKSYDLPLIDRPDYGYIKVELPKDSDGSTSTADQNQEPKN
jgi:hypothetical protein